MCHLNILGHMAKIWQKIEDSALDLCEFKELTKQYITMFRQVFNDITCNGRLSVLNVLMKEHKLKRISEEKASIFS